MQTHPCHDTRTGKGLSRNLVLEPKDPNGIIYIFRFKGIVFAGSQSGVQYRSDQIAQIDLRLVRFGTGTRLGQSPTEARDCPATSNSECCKLACQRDSTKGLSQLTEGRPGIVSTPISWDLSLALRCVHLFDENSPLLPNQNDPLLGALLLFCAQRELD